MLDSASLHLANFGWSPKLSNSARAAANKFARHARNCPVSSRHLLVKIFQGFSLFSYQCSFYHPPFCFEPALILYQIVAILSTTFYFFIFAPSFVPVHSRVSFHIIAPTYRNVNTKSAFLKKKVSFLKLF
jgi:hypothetical protein